MNGRQEILTRSYPDALARENAVLVLIDLQAGHLQPIQTIAPTRSVRSVRG